MALTLKKRLFIDHYKVVKNASEAARLAGYSPKTSGSYCTSLLKDPQIKLELDKWESETHEKLAEMARIPSKDEYTKETFRRSKDARMPSVGVRYWEIGGKVAGHLENSPQSAQVININLAKNMIVAVKDDEKLDNIRSLLSE